MSNAIGFYGFSNVPQFLLFQTLILIVMFVNCEVMDPKTFVLIVIFVNFEYLDQKTFILIVIFVNLNDLVSKLKKDPLLAPRLL